MKGASFIIFHSSYVGQLMSQSPLLVPMERVNWDSLMTRYFCDICKEECEAGNKPLGFLTTTGFTNVSDKFFNRTGRRLTRKQLKNKWDVIKKEFAQWEELRNYATGLGWNDRKGTIEADDSWWTAHLQVR